MDNRDLENINESGELSAINLGGTTAAKNVLTREQITALPVSTATQAALDLKADDLYLGEAITTTTPTGTPVAGNYYIAMSDGNVSYTNFGGMFFNKLDRIVWTGAVWGKQSNWESNLVPITGVRSDVDLGSNRLTANELAAITSYLLNGSSLFYLEDGVVYFNSDFDFSKINLQAKVDIGMTVAEIDAEGVFSAVTKQWVESKVTGATGSFTSSDGKTITVTGGLITEIA